MDGTLVSRPPKQTRVTASPAPGARALGTRPQGRSATSRPTSPWSWALLGATALAALAGLFTGALGLGFVPPALLAAASGGIAVVATDTPAVRARAPRPVWAAGIAVLLVSVFLLGGGARYAYGAEGEIALRPGAASFGPFEFGTVSTVDLRYEIVNTGETTVRIYPVHGWLGQLLVEHLVLPNGTELPPRPPPPVATAAGIDSADARMVDLPPGSIYRGAVLATLGFGVGPDTAGGWHLPVRGIYAVYFTYNVTTLEAATLPHWTGSLVSPQAAIVVT